jgi:hypothetical protein
MVFSGTILGYIVSRNRDMDKAIHNIKERCERICKKNRSDCLFKRENHTGCIADMIINKTSTINKTSSWMLTLSDALKMDDCDEYLSDSAFESMPDACEISNWIKYMQVMHLISLSSLVLNEKSEEKRKEIRYPFPREFEGQINIICDDMLKATLVNCSQKGMQILSSRPIEKGTVFKFSLEADVDEGSRNQFKATSVYCVPVEDSYVSGVRIQEMDGNGVFNFFSRVHRLMLDYNRRIITARA